MTTARATRLPKSPDVLTAIDLGSISLPPDTAILDALRVLVESRQIVLVVDADRKLIGTVTDGDVRRGLLRRIELTAPIAQIMNRSPATVPAGTSREVCLRIMREREFRHLPVLDADGRAIGIEFLSDLLRQSERDNWVVILAGGQGRRLLPLTETVPKPMLSVGGRPLLETIVEGFARQGFKQFFVSVNYMADKIEQHFGNGSQLGVRIEYLREGTPLGTAGPLGQLPERPSDPLIVMNGDVLTTINFNQLLAFHEEQKAAATMCVREYDFEVPFGVAETDGVNLVGISEKPVHRFFVNAGIYLIDPHALDLITPGEPLDMPAYFQALIKSGRKAAAYPIREYWMDVGRINDLEQAQRDFARVFG